MLPNSAPQASEVLQNVAATIAVDDGILYARTDSSETWVLGETAMRWRGANGTEEAYARDAGTTKRAADGTITRHPETTMVPNELFRVGGMLERATDVGLEETDDMYVLRWREHPGALTLYVDKETYAPLRFVDRSPQNTFDETIREFKVLPDTPANRRLLALQ